MPRSCLGSASMNLFTTTAGFLIGQQGVEHQHTVRALAA
jgi:hypothetical protein